MVEDPGTISIHERRRMLREIVHHQDAADKSMWNTPPMEPGDNTISYTDMMLDPSVSHAVSLIKEAVLGEGYHVEPAENSRGTVAMAADVHKNLEDLDTEAILDDGLSAIWRGFWPHEITWKYGQRRHWLDTLASIDPEQIALELDDKMRVTAVLSKPQTGGGDNQRIDADKMWIHIHKPGRTRPAGESILEPSFRAYSSKNRLLQFWGLSLQRFGTAQWMLQIPANTPPARQSTILSTFYAGRLDGVYMVPDDITATVVEPKQWANLTFEQALDYQDAEIAKAILLIRSPGSVASGQTYVTGQGIDAQSRATAHRLNKISRELVRSFNRQVIQPLCLANWGAPPAQCPTLCLAQPDPARIIALAPAIAALVSSGIASPETAAEQCGLPEPGPNARSAQDAAADKSTPPR